MKTIFCNFLILFAVILQTECDHSQIENSLEAMIAVLQAENVAHRNEHKSTFQGRLVKVNLIHA